MDQQPATPLRPYPRSGRQATQAELEAEDEEARQLLADRGLPPTWLDDDD